MTEENQRRGKLSDRHWLYSLKMVILSVARKGSGPPGLGDHIARSIHKKGMSLRNYGNYVGTIVCLSFNNDFS